MVGLKDNAPKWLEAKMKLLKNNFTVNTDYSYLKDCTVIVISKDVGNAIVISGAYFFDKPDSYDEFPKWCKELITAHRIIGVEEVR